MAKLASARDEAVKRLKLAVLRAAWRDAAMYATKAADAVRITAPLGKCAMQLIPSAYVKRAQ